MSMLSNPDRSLFSSQRIFLCANDQLLYNKKYDNGSKIMVAGSLEFFDDVDIDESPRMLNHNISWQEIKQTIQEEVKKLY